MAKASSVLTGLLFIWGFSAAFILTVILAVFKLAQVGLPASWSIAMITSPLWGFVLFALGILVLFFVGAGALDAIGHVRAWNRRRLALKRELESDD